MGLGIGYGLNDELEPARVRVLPTHEETIETQRILIEVQSRRLIDLADFKRAVAAAMDQRVTRQDGERLRLIRGALEAIR
jgi:hypothetical protein